MPGVNREGSEYGTHVPVMLETVIDLLFVTPGGTYLDATAGGGGHSAALLERLDDKGRVIALDRDFDAINALKERFSKEPRIQIIHTDFGKLGQNEHVLKAGPLSGVLFDFGVSSHMLDAVPERGFSHREAGKLDMRMDRSQVLTAHIVLNQYDRTKLTRIIREYGEEKRAAKVAQAIIDARPIENTGELSDVIRNVVPLVDEIKTVTRVFQAVRIEVNRELESIGLALPEATKKLKKGGRLVAMSYHSLEDRLVKKHIAEKSKDCLCPTHQPVCTCGGENAELKPVHKKVIKAGEDEIKDNPRARSVRIRAAEKIK